MLRRRTMTSCAIAGPIIRNIMMKKRVFLVLACVCGTASVLAQDLIVKRDSSRIEARVTEVSPSEVRYKRFSNPDGPTYVLPTADIHAIRYANGEEEVYELPAPKSMSSAPGTEPGSTSGSTASPAPRQYEVGDYYERGDVRGVVFQVEEDGWHGTIISLDEIMLPWCVFRKADAFATGADDLKDGMANMETLERYIAAHGLSWADFPAFEWCRGLGEGWYLPSIDEMLVAGHCYNGGSRTRYDRKARNRFNDTLREHGGKRMDRMVYYFTSTEQDADHAYTTHMDLEPPYSQPIPKHNRFLVRAVHRF
jgi:hypothetical protein